MFTKESLEKLRQKIDLFEVISAHIDLKRAGATYKALCPFHQEKSPSFIVQKGDNHYHCFGCGAHGDAIHFLMSYLNLSFSESVESLAERFHISLEEEEKSERGPDKSRLKEILQVASHFFHSYLMHSVEGRAALAYLFKRGITIDFIKKFEIGFSPENPELFLKVMKDFKFPVDEQFEAGLLNQKKRPFFRDRITFPIHNAFGNVVGFSARKIKESTFGGKYINSTETPLFKKSKMLFGLNFSRRRIVRERRALLVEGQIDCLKMIESGLNLTVAALGTAFGEGHVDELQKLGVRTVYFIFDGDEAGLAAASKAGDLFQKRGMEAKVVTLPQGSDPDDFLSRFGVEKLVEELERASEYLSFQVSFLSKSSDIKTPAGKAELVRLMKEQIQKWDEPVLVHESLKKLAKLVQLPEQMVGGSGAPFFHIQKRASLSLTSVDPNKVLEQDLLRWLVLLGGDNEEFIATAASNLSESHFWTEPCRKLFHFYMNQEEKDLLSIAAHIEDPSLIDEILKKKVNRERAREQFLETVQKLLDRQWMQKSEEIKTAIHSGSRTEEEIFTLARQFDDLKKQRPKASWINLST